MNIGVTVSDVRSFPERLATNLDHTCIPIGPGTLKQKIEQCDVLYMWHLSYDELTDCLQTATKLPTYIHVARQGKDEELVKLALSRGVRISYAEDVFTQNISEFAVTSVLMLAKNLHASASSRQWQKYSQRKVQDISVLVLGQGNIGKRVCALATQYGMHAYAVGKPEMLAYKETGILPLDTAILSKITAIICCLPLNESTENILGTHFFSLFRQVDFVNISRGGVLNTSGFEASINQGYVHAAVLDAFVTEPLPQNDSLWDNPNIVVSAHRSYLSDDWQELLHDQFIQQMRSIEKEYAG